MITEKTKNNTNSIINRLPDDDTMEIVLYGTAYPDVKAAIFRLDRLEDILEGRINDNAEELLREKKELVDEVIDLLTRLPDALIRKDSNMYETAVKVRRHLNLLAAMRWCESKRKTVRMYGRLIGAQEQGAHIRESDEQITTWRNAILQVAKEPLEYETVRDGYVG